MFTNLHSHIIELRVSAQSTSLSSCLFHVDEAFNADFICNSRRFLRSGDRHWMSVKVANYIPCNSFKIDIVLEKRGLVLHSFHWSYLLKRLRLIWTRSLNCDSFALLQSSSVYYIDCFQTSYFCKFLAKTGIHYLDWVCFTEKAA